MMKVIGILIIIGIVYALYRKGILKYVRYPVIKWGFTYNHSKNNRLSVSYSLFNSMENYAFVFKKSQEMTINYDVLVEKGSLTLKVRNMKGIVFEKTFTADEKGTFTFIPETTAHNVLVAGSFTKGRCEITFA